MDFSILGYGEFAWRFRCAKQKQDRIERKVSDAIALLKRQPPTWGFLRCYLFSIHNRYDQIKHAYGDMVDESWMAANLGCITPEEHLFLLQFKQHRQELWLLYLDNPDYIGLPRHLRVLL